MSNLRDLFPDTNFAYTLSGNAPAVLYVYNTNYSTVNNGGRCCQWTVPAGVRWARFEVYGGGGDGAGSCCCQQGRCSAGSGSYARRTIRVVPGETYTLCAGGTGCCATSCQGTAGFPSYACNASATYPLCLCASGGAGGISGCFLLTNGCISSPSQICGCACGFDFAICGTTSGNYDGVYCGYDGYQTVPLGVYEMAMGIRYSFDNCLTFNGCTAIGAGGTAASQTNAQFGVPGGSAQVGSGACCWGGFGNEGLVIVTYQ